MALTTLKCSYVHVSLISADGVVVVNISPLVLLSVFAPCVISSFLMGTKSLRLIVLGNKAKHEAVLNGLQGTIAPSSRGHEPMAEGKIVITLLGPFLAASIRYM